MSSGVTEYTCETQEASNWQTPKRTWSPSESVRTDIGKAGTSLPGPLTMVELPVHFILDLLGLIDYRESRWSNLVTTQEWSCLFSQHKNRTISGALPYSHLPSTPSLWRPWAPRKALIRLISDEGPHSNQLHSGILGETIHVATSLWRAN